jgi:hypothetical protein
LEILKNTAENNTKYLAMILILSKDKNNGIPTVSIFLSFKIHKSAVPNDKKYYF